MTTSSTTPSADLTLTQQEFDLMNDLGRFYDDYKRNLEKLISSLGDELVSLSSGGSPFGSASSARVEAGRARFESLVPVCVRMLGRERFDVCFAAIVSGASMWALAGCVVKDGD